MIEKAVTTRRGGLFCWGALASAALALATVWAYWPALRGAWLWDDGLEVSQDPGMGGASGWWAPWLHPAGMDYFPLKSTLQWVEWRLWPDHPAAFHLASVGFHLIAAGLVWRVLALLGCEAGWFAALVFALHPVAVESVAWIAEQKNLWSLIFLLLAVMAFLRYERTGFRGSFGWSLLWFCAALLCKTTVVMLPVWLLLLAWWHRGRIGWDDWLRSAPFGLAALGLGVVTLWFQAHRAVGLTGPLPPRGERLVQAAWSLVAYLRELVWPVDLAPIYPPVHAAVPAWMPLVALGLLLGGFWRFRSTWGRHALLGTGWIVLNLIPILGIVPLAYLRIAPRADHLAYLGVVGVAGLAAAGYQGIFGSGARGGSGWRRWGGGMVAAVAGLLLAGLTRADAAHYRDERSLWTWAVQRNPEAWLAHNNLGRIWLNDNRPADAVSELRSAVASGPPSAEVRVNLGSAEERLGKTAEARKEFEAALRIDPNFAGAYYNLGELALRAGDRGGAEADFRAAIRIDPAYAAAHNNLGLTLARNGDPVGAAAEYRRALALDPRLPEAHLNLGNLLARAGRYEEAVGEFRAALQIDPGYEAARRNLDATEHWMSRSAPAGSGPAR